jgi:adenylate cyclase
VIAEGLRLAEQAISLDPTYALPKALAAWCYAQRVVYMRTAVPGEDKQKAFRLAQEAASLDHTDPLVLTVLSAAYALVGQFDLGLAAIEKALAIDPNSAWAWTRSGYLNVYTQCPDRAIEHFRRAIRLSPLDPMHYNALFGIGAAHFAKGDYREAVKWVEQALSEKPSAMWAYRLLATAYANAGHLEEARWAASKLRAAYPEINIKSLEATSTLGAMRGFVEGLRLAGIPE